MWMTTYWKGHHPTERKLLEQQRAQKYCSVYRNHREGWILNPSPPRINLVCFQGSIYPGETALWWCNQAPSPKSELELQNNCFMTACWHLHIYWALKAQLQHCIDNQEGQMGGSCPKTVFFFFNFPPWSNFTLAILQVTALCLGILRMFTETELRKTTQRFPGALKISLSGRSFNAPVYWLCPWGCTCTARETLILTQH